MPASSLERAARFMLLVGIAMMVTGMLLPAQSSTSGDTLSASKSGFSGTLSKQPSQKSYYLSVPVTTVVGEQSVQISSFSLPLALPEGLNPDALEVLVGSPVNVGGYLYGEPKQLLVTDLVKAVGLPNGATTGKTSKAPANPKSDDYLPKEVEEKKK